MITQGGRGAGGGGGGGGGRVGGGGGGVLNREFFMFTPRVSAIFARSATLYTRLHKCTSILYCFSNSKRLIDIGIWLSFKF